MSNQTGDKAMKPLPLAALLLCAALPAAAQSREELQLPPASYDALTFLHPNGCLYTRADAPGCRAAGTPSRTATHLPPGPNAAANAPAS